MSSQRDLAMVQEETEDLSVEILILVYNSLIRQNTSKLTKEKTKQKILLFLIKKEIYFRHLLSMKMNF